MPRVVKESGGSGGGGTPVLDRFVTTPGETAFTLSQTPVDGATVLLFVNGVLYDNGIDYTVVGTAVTWGNVLFALGPPDVVLASYQKA